MRQLRNYVAAIAAGLALLLASCETEPVTPSGPTVSVVLSNGADTLTVFEDSVFTIQVTTSSGDATLTQINVKQDGQNVGTDRLVFDGDPAGSNPSPLASNFGGGFSWDIDITADQAATSTYQVIIVDTDGLRDTAEFDIFTVPFVAPGTPTDTMSMVLLINKAGNGPNDDGNSGGLDLESGVSTGTSAAADSADLFDNGIDLNLPLADNWLQTFGPANGADLRIPAAGVDFDMISTKEEISAAYEGGTSVTTTEKVQTGDQFIVRSSDGNTFLLKVSNIVVIVGTPNTNDNKNDDYYEFSVKF